MFKMKPVAAAIGSAVVASIAVGSASADSLFVSNDLGAGYQLLAAADAEGKCGEGKCGEGKAEGEGKCGEGKTEAAAEGAAPAEGEAAAAEGEKAEGEGKCGEGKAEGEGKCGEGKCGAQ